MASNNSSSGGGLSLGSVLLVVFIVLKLVGVIDWPWIWVLSPLWIGVLVWAFILLLLGVFYGDR